MNWTKNLHLLFIGFLCGAMLMSFQNCGETLDLNTLNNASNTPANPNAPIIQNSITELSATERQALDIQIQASGENLFYTWWKNGQDLGVNGSSLNFSSVALTDAGTYTVEVSNDFGFVRYDITLTVTNAPVPPAPVITTPVNNINVSYINTTFFVIPVNQANPASATFSVAVTGQELGYQWYRVADNAEVPINGATTATYSFNVSSVSQAGTYRVRVSNSGGSVMSSGVMSINMINIGNIGF